MNLTSKQILSLLTITLIALALIGCSSLYETPSAAYDASLPGSIDTPNPAYGYAQATMDYGQSQLLDLSRRATEVSLNMAQAANAAAQSTRDYNQRLQMDLDFQATIISLNITHAAATQDSLYRQTQIAIAATALVEMNNATATQAAFLMNRSQTAQVQAILEGYAQQTVQAVAAMTAYPLTATPYAKTQAAMLMQQYDREQRAFENQILAPLVPYFALFVVLMVLLVVVLVYRRYRPGLWARRLRLGSGNMTPNPYVMIDGVILNPDPRRVIPPALEPVASARMPGQFIDQIEIIDPAEPPVAHWIAEVEQQLSNEGKR